MTETQLSNEVILLRQMVETIVREAAPEVIILFGSRARGDARPDSDVDLLVVETEPFSPPTQPPQGGGSLVHGIKGAGGFQGYSPVQQG